MRAAVTALWIERGINLITVSMPENTVDDMKSGSYSFVFPPGKPKQMTML